MINVSLFLNMLNSFFKRWRIFYILFLFFSSTLTAQDAFIVTSTEDTGGMADKTLRNAINQVNLGTVNKIVFDIQETNPVIVLNEKLPPIEGTVVMNGENTNGGKITLDVKNVDPDFNGAILGVSFNNDTDECEILNFVINNFPPNSQTTGIAITRSVNSATISTVSGNIIGLDVSESSAVGDPSFIGMDFSARVVANKNVISNWTKYGLFVNSNNAIIQNNKIGRTSTERYSGVKSGPALKVESASEVIDNTLCSDASKTSFFLNGSPKVYRNAIGFVPFAPTHTALEIKGNSFELGDDTPENRNFIGGIVRSDELGSWRINEFMNNISLMGTSETVPRPSNVEFDISSMAIKGNAAAGDEVFVFFDDDELGARKYFSSVDVPISGEWSIPISGQELNDNLSSGFVNVRALSFRVGNAVSMSSVLSDLNPSSVLNECDPFVVTSLNDPALGESSVCGELRHAIEQVNLDLDVNEITFNFSTPVTSPYVINLDRSLPILSSPVKINGWSATGDKSKPGVRISGGNVGSTEGLFLDANCTNSEVVGLSITDFTGLDNYGLTLGANDCKIYGNYFGLDVDGQSAGNFNGLVIFGNNNSVGFNNDGVDDAFERNVFSSNASNGILLKSVPSPVTESSGNKIKGNYFGLAPDGTTILTNNTSGVGLNLSVNNVIGGTTPSERNYFSLAADFHGVFFGGGANRNQVIGNWIGLDINGNPARGANSNAIRIGNSNSGNSIGDDVEDISANRLNGKILVSNSAQPTEDNKWGINSYLDIIEFNPGPGQEVQNDVMPPSNLQSINRTVTMDVALGAKVFIFASAQDNAEEFVHVMDEVMGNTTISYEIPLARATDLATNGFNRITAIQSVRSTTTTNFNSSELASHVDFDFCATPLTVTKTTDDGTCGTFRRAINFVNTNGPNQLITFDFPDANTTITLDGTVELTQSNITVSGGTSGVRIVPNTNFSDLDGATELKRLIHHQDAVDVIWQNIFFDNISAESVVALSANGASTLSVDSCSIKDFQVGLVINGSSSLAVINGTEIYSSSPNIGQVDGIRVSTGGGFSFTDSYIPYMNGNGMTVSRAFSSVNIENSFFGVDTPLGVIGGVVNQVINIGGTPDLETNVTIKNNEINNNSFGAIFLADNVRAVVENNTITNGVDGVLSQGTNAEVNLSQNLISTQSNLPITNTSANAYIPIIMDVNELPSGNYLIAGDVPDNFEPLGVGVSFDFRIELFGTNSNQAEVFVTFMDFNSAGEWQFPSVNVDIDSYTHLTATATYLNNTSPLSVEKEIVSCKYIADAGLDQTICADVSIINLQATFTGGSFSGEWAKGDASYDGDFEGVVGLELPYTLGVNDLQRDSLYFINTPSAFPDPNCEVVPDTITIFINELPGVTIEDLTTSCDEEYSLTTTSGDQVEWYEDAVTNPVLAVSDSIRLAGTGTYIASFTSIEGCTSKDMITLDNNNPLFISPVVTINTLNGMSLCNGDVLLESDGVPAGYTVAWFNNDTNAPVGMELTYLTSISGNHYFEAVSPEGCEVVSEFVLVAPCAPIVKDSVFNLLVDDVFTVDLAELIVDNGAVVDVNSVVFTNPVSENNWSNDNGTIEYTPVAGFEGIVTIDYTVMSTDGTGSNISTLTINYSADPCLGFSSGVVVSPNTEICSGEVTLSVPSVSGVNYQWSYSNLTNKIIGATTNEYSARLEGSYFLRYSGVCSGELEVLVEYGSSVSVTNTSGLLEGEATGASGYQWYAILPEGSRAIVGANSQNYNALFDGEYYIQALFSGNCVLNSNLVAVNSTSNGTLVKAGLLQTESEIFIPEAQSSSLSVFPNPSEGTNLNLRFVSYKKGTFTVSMFDLAGLLITKETIVKNEASLQLNLNRYTVKPGVYMLVVEQNGIYFREKTVIK